MLTTRAECHEPLTAACRKWQGLCTQTYSCLDHLAPGRTPTFARFTCKRKPQSCTPCTNRNLYLSPAPSKHRLLPMRRVLKPSKHTASTLGPPSWAHQRSRTTLRQPQCHCTRPPPHLTLTPHQGHPRLTSHTSHTGHQQPLSHNIYTRFQHTRRTSQHYAELATVWPRPCSMSRTTEAPPMYSPTSGMASSA